MLPLTAALLLPSPACTQVLPPDELDGDVVVVERSKARPPAWAALKPNTLTTTDDDYRLLTVRSKLLNLTLGLKQTQMIGEDAARAALAALVEERLLSTAGAHGSELSASVHSGLARLISEATETAMARYGKVTDLYYEGVDNHLAAGGDPMAHYYVVYILITYPKNKLPDLYHDLATRLGRAEGPALSRFLGPARSLAGPAV